MGSLAERQGNLETSEEVDENGFPFIKASNGTTIFGVVDEDTGLTAAPIKLSEGYQDQENKGYSLKHIEANHGQQIRKAGFPSVEEFVSYVASNYDKDNIRVGKRRENGSATFLLQITDTHDNTLFIELSKDGSYWNVNSAGIFRKGYSNKKETVVKTEPQQPNNAVSSDSSLSESKGIGTALSEPNGEPTVSSAAKDKQSFDTKQVNEQKSAENNAVSENLLAKAERVAAEEGSKRTRKKEEAKVEAQKEADGKKNAVEEPKVSESSNRLVTDERYEELKKRMKAKLRGQLNIGVDPEILAIGTEMAVYHIEKGARAFSEYAKGMIADLGDAIRPYLKAFYNGARDLPEMTELSKEMTSYDDVSKFNVATIGKEGEEVKPTVFDTAEQISNEATVEHNVHEEVKQTTETEDVNNDVYSITKQHNNKKDVDIWVVRGKERVERYVFIGQKREAKESNGYYSSFRGVNGFVFNTPEDAQSFANSAFAEKKDNESSNEKNSDDVLNNGVKTIIEQFDNFVPFQLEGVKILASTNPYNAFEHYVDNEFEDWISSMVSTDSIGEPFYDKVFPIFDSEELTKMASHLFAKDIYDKYGRDNKSIERNESPSKLEQKDNVSMAERIDEKDKPILERNGLKIGDKVLYHGKHYEVEAFKPNGRIAVGRDTGNIVIPRMHAETWQDEVKEIEPQHKENQPKSSTEKKNNVSSQVENDLFGGLFSESELKSQSNGLQRVHEERTEGLSTESDERSGSRSSSQDNGEVRQKAGGTQRGSEIRNERTGGELSQSNRRPTGRLSRLNTTNNHAECGVDYAPTSVDARIAANIKAIELANDLIESGEKATPEQMAVLRKFSGWGGLGKAFSTDTPISRKLQEMLGTEAYEQAVMSANSAYYTPAYVIDTLWDVAKQLGFKGGNITEVSKEEFKKWIDSSKRKTKPFVEYSSVKAESDVQVEHPIEKNDTSGNRLQSTKSGFDKISQEQSDALVSALEKTDLANSVNIESHEDFLKGLEERQGTIELQASLRRDEREGINRSIDEARAFVTGRPVKEVRKERIEDERKRKQHAKEIYENVLSGNFNDVSLRQINDYINEVTPLNPFGRRLSQRLPQAVERRMYGVSGKDATGDACKWDALYSRICEASVRLNERFGKAGRRAIEERKKEVLKAWAIATGNWHTDSSDFTDDKEPIASGIDSDVYLSKDEGHVIKLSKGKTKGKFLLDLDNIPLFNSLFPNTAYKIVGYGEINGNFVRILEQPFVDFSNATPFPWMSVWLIWKS